MLCNRLTGANQEHVLKQANECHLRPCSDTGLRVPTKNMLSLKLTGANQEHVEFKANGCQP